MVEIIIVNKKSFEAKKAKFKQTGPLNFHVLSDFDRTLTRAFVNGKKMPSVISELRSGPYISEDYSKKANELASFYHPIEMDLNISLEEKKAKMLEWWTKHFDLLIASGLKKEHIKQIIYSGKIQFRDKALELFEILNEAKIPHVILSSAGLGGDSIRILLEKERKLNDNIHIVSNVFEWDVEGRAIGVKKPIIHVFNKSEISIKQLPIYTELLKRKNVLLLGDSLGDLGMSEGFPYENLIKIGFLDYDVEKNLESYKKAFDVVITDDGDLGFVVDLVKEIVG
jgi:5'-nucleotidase